MTNKQNQSEQTLIQSLNKIMGEQYINYRGCVLRRLVGGWEFNKKKYTKLSDIDDEIDRTLNVISDSIKKGLH